MKKSNLCRQLTIEKRVHIFSSKHDFWRPENRICIINGQCLDTVIYNCIDGTFNYHFIYLTLDITKDHNISLTYVYLGHIYTSLYWITIGTSIGLTPCGATTSHLKQWWLHANKKNQLQWNWNQYTKIFDQENWVYNVAWKNCDYFAPAVMN